MLHYVFKYYFKSESKIAKLANIMKNFILQVSSKNPIYSLVVKFINKLIGKRNIFVQKACYLFLELDLSNFFYTLILLNVKFIKQLICDVSSIKIGHTMPNNIYLKKYCFCLADLKYLFLYQMQMLYNWLNINEFKLQMQEKSRILNIFSAYTLDPN